MTPPNFGAPTPPLKVQVPTASDPALTLKVVAEVVPAANTKEELHDRLNLYMRGEVAHEHLSSSEDTYRGFVMENMV